MADYEAVIGLEVHAQLKTNTKLFCSCSTEFGKEPNSNVCPVCTGQPGSLPVLNRKAVEYAVKMALAIDCTVKEYSVFARKNYFYPDLPMGYQISQFDLPFSEHGKVDIEVGGETKTIGVTRIHMENDAGKSIHSHAENASFVDLNRAGTPLIEIVSDPDMRSADEAVAYLKALHSILLYLGICDGNMEEGNFRCDANVSIRPRGQKEFGTRAELKNMNSFRNVHRAITYEIARQEDLLEDGEEVIQETRLFDADRGVTASMRGKEEAHDYRYFPDPDLVPLVLEREWIEKLRSELPELPAERLARFLEEYALPQADAEVLTGDRALADYFEAAVKAYDKPKKISNWVMTDVLRMLNETGSGIEGCGFAPEDFAKLVRIVDEGVINQKVGKQVFAEMFAEGGDPEAYVKEKGLVQISDTGALETAIDEIIAENPSEAEAFRGGKTKLMGFFVGQVMRKTKGQANPKLVNQILADKLK